MDGTVCVFSKHPYIVAMTIPAHRDYLLGINESEEERLRFQHHVWRENTDSFLDRIDIQKGWNCLDVGAGPGFVSLDLRERVGDEGEIAALEPSEFFLGRLREESARRGWTNIKPLAGSAETIHLEESHYNLIFIRWVIAFVPDPRAFLLPLVKALKPGGVLAVMDYYYEGLSLYPRGGAFDRAPEAVRAYYRAGGGDPYVTGGIPRLFRELGLKVVDFSPTQMSGGPESEIIEWAHRFFLPHLPLMAEKGVVTEDDAHAMLQDWISHRRDPNTIFFSPILIHVAGQKPE
jgi:ubiquinone/menaquinone biosynthesis C-methylase UbiE